ncbi:MAG TPA: lamin tail domain-containing protein, partial [Chthoniobacteraceae bacterium]|nr:lamin tail domain-containing protein [Chthoniobacteraceae bacterium]
MKLPLRLLPLCLWLATLLPLGAVPVINELHFHPAGVPEDPTSEWIEFHNSPGTGPIDLSGWKLTKGVTFQFPAGTSLPPAGYLVVAANLTKFQAEHPGFSGVVLGGWTGRLSNSTETVRLENAAGVKIDEVTYADEGDWAVRTRGPVDLGHQGWTWTSAADGEGKTMERRNPELAGFDTGQNWLPSVAVGGSPGAANSAASTDIAPLILEVQHRPVVPRSSDAVKVSARLGSELGDAATAQLRWRQDGVATFNAVPMTDLDGDGDVEASIPQQASGTIVEFYIEATDAGSHSRAWPAPAAGAGQVANALYQVDDSFNPNLPWTPGAQPILRVIMRAVEYTELQRIWSTASEANSDAAMNATFVSVDGTGIETRYLASVRNRGASSRTPPSNAAGANNSQVSFPHDALWKGRENVQLNSRYGHSQSLGALLFARAGLAAQNGTPVQVRFNGQNRTALNTSTSVMFGSYAQVESLDGDWAERHFPLDSEGNLYQVRDDESAIYDQGNLRYEGPDAAAYRNTYFKQTNQDEDQWSDLIQLTDKLTNAPAATYREELGTVLDLDQWIRFLVTDSLIGNREGGLQSAKGDDFALYRGVNDPRFLLLPHDLDTTMSFGGVSAEPNRSIFTYEGIVGLTRLLNDPAILPDYYSAFLEAMETWFNPEVVNPLIDQTISYTGASAVAAAKNFLVARRAGVLAQIQQNYSLAATVSGSDVDGFKQSTDGSAVFGGTFNVARTRSILVNGVPAQLFYRTSGTNAAGTWRLPILANSGFLKPGINRVTANFHEGVNGSGTLLYTATVQVYFAGTGALTTVSGTLSATAPQVMEMIAPASYVPGVPMLVRLDLKDLAGKLDRSAWNRTATLSAGAGVTLTPSTVQLYNGMGSALVTLAGSGGTGGVQTLIPRGSAWKYLDSGVDQGTAWRAVGFAETGWLTGNAELGRSDGGEATVLGPLPVTSTSRTTYYFRKTFNVADPAAVASARVTMRYDDGAIIYINGQQAVITAGMTANMPASAFSTATRSGALEDAYETFTFPASLLVAGANTIAVEVHQATTTQDISFDLDLQAVLPTGDPGNFTLAASIGSASASNAVASLGSPTMTNVAGVLPGSSTRWSGVVHVTADVTVPVGHTLTIDPGTHVLIEGTTGAGSSTGTKLIVQGTVNANGTAAQPISITASSAAARWGEIQHTTATPSTYRYCLISRACHSPAGGHTGTGPMVRLAGATITFEDCVLSDSPGKTLTNSGNCNITFRRCHLARTVMGPEIGGSALLIEQSNLSEMLPAARESGAADDEDCIYIHDSGGRSVVLRGTVLAVCGDDALDCLAGDLLVEECIIRNAFDKGVSLLRNNITIRRTQIIDNDIGISAKTQDPETAVPFTCTLENVTIVCEEHPTNTSDGTFHSVGLHTRNKYGTATANLPWVVRNSIISAYEPVRHDYPVAGNPFPNTNITYSVLQDLQAPMDALPTGVGNITADPLFVGFASDDYHLTASSPARDAGDPASPPDPDNSRADMGAFVFAAPATGGTIVTWTPAGGPYHVVDHLVVPLGLTLAIQPGTSVYVAQNKRITVNGRLLAQGTADARIVFSHEPGTVAAGDADPIKNGVQTGPPKWGGVRVVDSLAQENVVAYCDFINAQGTDPATSENYGSIGFIRSWGLVDHCTWAGSHLRMCYGRNCKLTVRHCVFPDMFIFDPVLGRDENPTDFLASGDNRQEQLKVEYPLTDPEVSGNPTYANGMPTGGHWRVYYNDFYGNKGHNDVFDADSGRWGQPGQFLLDCRYNHFHGVTGDEHIDLGGDAYIASNIFERGTKDQWTSDTGYANAISSGDKGTGTTIMVARNRFLDLDHAINLKANTATIFEHNTAANFHADYVYNGTSFGTPFTQNVKNAAVNVFIPEDGTSPTVGDGGYLGFNLLSRLPRLVSGADQRKTAGNLVTDITTKLEFQHNLVDQITDPTIGANHPGGIFNPAYGVNTPGAPGFVDSAAGDFDLRLGSAARARAPGGLDYGWTIPEWAYVLGGPATQSPLNSATFLVGGPGIVAYKWRLDEGSWSAPIQIGAGGVFPRNSAAVRQATLQLTGLANGPHTLEVLGQDMAGNWQAADPAKSPAEQAGPTVRTWTVNTTLQLLRINEVLADGASTPDTVELYNAGAVAVNLSAYRLTDDPAVPTKFPLPAIALAPGAYATVSGAPIGL